MALKKHVKSSKCEYNKQNDPKSAIYTPNPSCLPPPSSYLSSSLSTSVLSTVPLSDLHHLLQPLPLFLPSVVGSFLIFFPFDNPSPFLRLSSATPSYFLRCINAAPWCLQSHIACSSEVLCVCCLTNFSFLLFIQKLCRKSLCPKVILE